MASEGESRELRASLRRVRDVGKVAGDELRPPCRVHARGDEATDADGEQADRAEEEGREDQLTHEGRERHGARVSTARRDLAGVAEPRDRLLRGKAGVDSVAEVGLGLREHAPHQRGLAWSSTSSSSRYASI